MHGLSPEAVVADQRRRILVALTEVVLRDGYQATGAKGVCALAGVSRRTFYELFEGKDTAFCAAFSEALAPLAALVRMSGHGKWPPGLATLRWIAVHPSASALLVAEPLTAGPHLSYCHDRLFATFGPCLGRGRRHSPVGLPPNMEEMLLAGFIGIVAGRLREDQAASLPPLAPQLTELLLAPYVGLAEASRIADA